MLSRMRQAGVCVRIGGYDSRRVLPRLVRNIRNIEIIEKETLIEQGVTNKKPFHQHRNTVERAGTTCSAMFRNCSAKPFSPERPVALAARALQRFARKTCSGMFRQRGNTANRAVARAPSSLQPFASDACSGCSGGWHPVTRACWVAAP